MHFRTQAAGNALAQLPEGASIDLALIHVSSVYGNAERLTSVIPTLREALPQLGAVVGCSCAGVLGMKGKRAVEVRDRCEECQTAVLGLIHTQFKCFEWSRKLRQFC